MKAKTKRIAAYTVSGVTFLGAVTGLLVNMTRLGDSLGSEETGQIQIMPTLIQEAPPEPEYVDADGQHAVKYVVDKSGGDIAIAYQTDAIDGAVKSVGILGEGPFFALPKVGIDIKMVNNTDEAIFVTDAVIDVRTSQTNTDPLLISIQHEGIVGYIDWLNDGWGEPDLAEISARIVGSDAAFVALSAEPEPDTLSDALIYRFDIAPLLADIGIEKAAYDRARSALDNDDYAPEHWQDIQAKCLRAYGSLQDIAEFIEMISGEAVDPATMTDEQIGAVPFGCAAEVEGELTFTWNKNGTAQTRSRKFTLPVMITPPDGLGAAGFQPTGAYEFELKTDGTNYTINVPISQPVAPAGFDRFVLWLGAAKSSSHDFEIRLQYNQDGEIKSQPIRLEYLRPKSTADQGG